MACQHKQLHNVCPIYLFTVYIYHCAYLIAYSSMFWIYLCLYTSCCSAKVQGPFANSIPLAPSHFRHRGGEKIRRRQEDLLLLGTKDAQHEVVAVAEVPVLDSAGGVVNHERIQKVLFDLENQIFFGANMANTEIDTGNIQGSNDLPTLGSTTNHWWRVTDVQMRMTMATMGECL